MTIMWRILLCLVLAATLPIEAANRITLIRDTVAPSSGQELFFTFKGFSSSENVTTLSFEIRAVDIPFDITGVKYISGDSEMEPVSPFAMQVSEEDINNRLMLWDVTVDIPFLNRFDANDRLVVDTDLGQFEMFSAKEAVLIEKSAEEKKRLEVIGSIILIAVIAVTLLAIGFYRRRLAARDREMTRMSEMANELKRHTDLLRENVNELYGKQTETLNMLCNSYFERSGSDKTRLTLYNEVERQILAMRSPDHLAGLAAVVNKYRDNILDRIHTQIPSLTTSDLNFLTYIYAGFSPRAICIFCDIKIKNFYNRRSRLKDKIAMSGAADTDIFIGLMQ